MEGLLKILNKKISARQIVVGSEILILVSIVGCGAYYYLKNKTTTQPPNSESTFILEVSPIPSPTPEPTPSPTPSPTPPKAEVKKKITETPPEQKNTTITQTTTTNSDGSKTTVVAEGEVAKEKLPEIAKLPPSGSTPESVKFVDETGKYAYLESELKTFLSDQLRWSGEISQLRQISLMAAGNSGWSGQWVGTYTIMPNGDINSAYGAIILNVSYYENNPYFTDYMKLILSHEYGHHYTQYYKWVTYDLEIGARFPDSYYSIRPLSKSTTTTDCSASWSTCESEIIAEDYSYIYSGYDYHALKDTFGYPSAATRTWLNNLPSGSSASPTPASNQPPTVSITSPLNDATVDGIIEIKAVASDDNGVTKVDFYLGKNLIGTDTSSPYTQNVNTKSYANGSYVVKVVAYDSSESSESSISLQFKNTETDTQKPTVSFDKPQTNPSDWSKGDLLIEAVGEDNVAVVKIELYINDTKVAEEDDSGLARSWQWFVGGIDSYTIRARAYDAVGNFADVDLVVNKTK